MVHPTLSPAGHKAIPGKYRFALKMGDRTVTTEAEILANPLYPGTNADYLDYHALMSRMEGELTLMHETVKRLHEKQLQLSAIVEALPAGEKYEGVKREAEALVKKLKDLGRGYGPAEVEGLR